MPALKKTKIANYMLVVVKEKTALSAVTWAGYWKLISTLERMVNSVSEPVNPELAEG